MIYEVVTIDGEQRVLIEGNDNNGRPKQGYADLVMRSNEAERFNLCKRAIANSAWGLSAQIDAHWHVDLHFAVSRHLDGGRVYKAAYAEVRKEQGTPE